MREQAFNRRIDAHFESMYALEATEEEARANGFTFSDDEDEYNYYTDSDEEFERFAEQQFSRLRTLFGNVIPILATAAAGYYLVK